VSGSLVLVNNVLVSNTVDHAGRSAVDLNGMRLVAGDLIAVRSDERRLEL
jgi:hypothetical protein